MNSAERAAIDVESREADAMLDRRVAMWSRRLCDDSIRRHPSEAERLEAIWRRHLSRLTNGLFVLAELP